MASESAEQALSILRDPSAFQWYVIPLLLVVIYIYAVEVEKKNWNGILAALAFYGMDWFNEVWNGLVFHFTQFAPVWGAPGKTAFLILIGLNIEITFMFAIMGVVATKFLAGRDKDEKILRIPNRLFMAVLGSVLCVVVELFLNAAGALTWDYPWWSARAPWLIFLIGYLTFWLVAYWVYDMESRRHQLLVLGTIWAVDLVSLAVFIPLGWI
ncbi:MAG: hypothetical protein ACTSU5_10380 [Promethearchaeota archaeon]